MADTEPVMSASTQTYTFTLEHSVTLEILRNADVATAKGYYLSFLKAHEGHTVSVEPPLPLDWQDYRDNENCPRCGGGDLSFMNKNTEGTIAFQSVSCSLCDLNWTDDWSLVNHYCDGESYPVEESN